MKVIDTHKYFLEKRIDVTIQDGLREVVAEAYLDYNPADLYPDINIYQIHYTVYWLDGEIKSQPTEEEIKLIESTIKNYYNDNK